MNTAAIICVGNRFAPGDAVGCRVYDRLAGRPLPEDVALFDGGLCGLDLVHLVEGRRRVVFADAVTGMAATGAVVVLDGAEVAALAQRYGHSAGLPYLLHLLPRICPAPVPEILVVGAETALDAAGGIDAAVVEALAARCLELAVDGLA